MAENRQYRHSGEGDFFLSDDDPLAELARIVGEREPAGEVGKREAFDAPTQDLGLDLEAELVSGLLQEDWSGVAPAAETVVSEPEEPNITDLPAFLKPHDSDPEEGAEPPGPGLQAAPAGSDGAADHPLVQTNPVSIRPTVPSEEIHRAIENEHGDQKAIADSAAVDEPMEEPIETSDSLSEPEGVPEPQSVAPEAGAYLAGRPGGQTALNALLTEESVEVLPETDLLTDGDLLREDDLILDDDAIARGHEDSLVSDDWRDVPGRADDDRLGGGIDDTGSQNDTVSQFEEETSLPAEASAGHPDIRREETPAEGDVVFRDFVPHEIPDREVVPAVPATGAFEAEPDHEPAAQDDWAIADELERAFAELAGRAPPAVRSAGAPGEYESNVAAAGTAPVVDGGPLLKEADTPHALPYDVAEDAPVAGEIDKGTFDFATLDFTDPKSTDGSALVEPSPTAEAGNADFHDPVFARPQAEPEFQGDIDLDFDFDHFELEMEQAAQALDDSVAARAYISEPSDNDDVDERGEGSQQAPPDGWSSGTASSADRMVETVADDAASDLEQRWLNDAGSGGYKRPQPAEPALEGATANAGTDDADAPLHPGFDPRDLSDTTGFVEPMQEIDIPELPRTEELPRSDPVDEFDISELEAEFAEMLARDEGSSLIGLAGREPAAPSAAGVAPRAAKVRDPDTIDFSDFDFSEMTTDPAGGSNRSTIGADRHGTEQMDPSNGTMKDGAYGAGGERALPSNRSRTLPRWTIGAGLLIAVGALGGAWFFLSGGGTGGDEPRIIAADDTPLKVAPEDPGGRVVPNQDQAVYDQVAGTRVNRDVNLVSRSEEPVDVVQRTVDPQVLPLEGRPAVGVNGETDDTAGGPIVPETLTANDNDPLAVLARQAVDERSDRPGIVPRRVQTMVVRPDGTLVPRETEIGSEAPAVTSDDARASGALIATADSSEATGFGPLVPDGSDPAAPTAAGGVPLPQPRPEASAASLPAAGEAAERLLPDTGPALETGAANDAVNAPTRTVQTTVLDENRITTPPVQPAEQPVTGGATAGAGESQTQAPPLETAAAAPAPSASAAAPIAAGGLAPSGQAIHNPGGYVVQIASQPSEESARSTYESLAQRHAAILGGRQAQIQAAEIPDRGTFYRVRVAGGTREEATALCQRYQAAGGSCFVAR